MPPRTKPGSIELGSAIRRRREELRLSIDEAASRAGVGAKTWRRYEAGEAIRDDKVRGLCRALAWASLPGETSDGDEPVDDGWLRNVGESHEAWSAALVALGGVACATTFAVGSDLISDHVQDDLTALASQPRGTHIGELPASWIDGSLPPQFLPRYDYEFMFALARAVEDIRERFAAGHLAAHTVLEEIAVYMIFAEAEMLEDLDPELYEDADGDWREWVGDILGDLDVDLFLYSTRWVVTPRIAYHFDLWFVPQFHSGDDRLTATERAAEHLGVLLQSPHEHISLHSDAPDN